MLILNQTIGQQQHHRKQSHNKITNLKLREELTVAAVQLANCIEKASIHRQDRNFQPANYFSRCEKLATKGLTLQDTAPDKLKSERMLQQEIQVRTKSQSGTHVITYVSRLFQTA